MSGLSELVSAAVKMAADGAVKGKGIISDALKAAAAVTAGEAAEDAAKKTGILRTNKYGNLEWKIPFFKSTEEKIQAAFEKHPERDKVCFQFPVSLKDGVDFYNPEGEKAFVIPKGKKNLRRFELLKNGYPVGSISKLVTINFNPFKDVQRYNCSVRGNPGIIKVDGFNSSLDTSFWKLKSQHLGKYAIENSKGEEIGRVYPLGISSFVMDYDKQLDPVELILGFMAIRIRIQEVRENHSGSRGEPLFMEAIDHLKDIF